MFALQGWPTEQLCLDGMTEVDVRFLVGGMMAVPSIGAVLAAMLHSIPLRSELQYEHIDPDG